MTWFKRNFGNIGLFEVRRNPQLMAWFVQEKMIALLRQSCRHEQAAARICWALADRAADPRNYVLFERMAMNEKRQVSRQAGELARLGASPSPDRDTWQEKVWRLFLVELGPYYAMKWVRFMKRGDLRHLIQLKYVMKAYRYDEHKGDV